MDAHAASRVGGPAQRGTLLVGVLLLVALVAWIVTIDRMSGMDAGPGTALGGLGWFTGVWVTMMAAMMLPSAAPVVVLFNRTAVRSARPGAVTAAFVGGSLAVWTVFGVAAYALYRAIAALDPPVLVWDRGGPWIAGGAVALAGLHQLSRLKHVCLRHCRSPLHFLLARRHPGTAGALRMAPTTVCGAPAAAGR